MVGKSTMRALLAVGAALATAVAFADPIEGPVFRIDVQAPNGSGSWEQPFDPDLYNPETGVMNWQLMAPVVIEDGEGRMLATLDQAQSRLDTDPQVSLGFLVTAGNSAITITICSAVVNFAPLNPATATASAQVGATDINGDGVVVTGNYLGGTKSYHAWYNGATTYAMLVNNFAGGAFQSPVSTEGNPPGGGFNNIGGPVSSMQACFSLNLSAQDQAGGTSTYVILPEPSSMLLISLGALAALRRGR